MDTIDIDGNIKGYKFHNVTKYYENDIIFIAHEDKHINLVPIELLEHVEGCIVYFDSENVSAKYYNFHAGRSCVTSSFCAFQKEFLNKLPMYANFIESNNIEFGILLCNELYDNQLDGITYKEAKSFSNILDVIELSRVHENDDDDQNNAATGHHDPVGYDELLQAIRAIIWSNVDLKRKSTARSDNGSAGEPKEPTDIANDVDDNNIEQELAGFEQLLTEVMMFKDTTSSWSRTERLAYAEKFACKLARQRYPGFIICECPDSLNDIFLSSAVAFDNLLQNGNGKKSTADNLDGKGSSSDESD